MRRDDPFVCLGLNGIRHGMGPDTIQGARERGGVGDVATRPGGARTGRFLKAEVRTLKDEACMACQPGEMAY